VTLPTALQRTYNSIKADLTQAAEKMPEADFAFKPTPNVRSFAQLFTHVATSNFGACAAVKGETNPNQDNSIDQKTSKADVMKALADSFTYCDSIFSTLTQEGLVQMIVRGQNQFARGWAITHTLEHGSEMYGIATVYLRLKGIVPPSTERELQLRRPAGK
jgi:uncharacterized damage-inducible protein DinB